MLFYTPKSNQSKFEEGKEVYLGFDDGAGIARNDGIILVAILSSRQPICSMIAVDEKECTVVMVPLATLVGVGAPVVLVVVVVDPAIATQYA